MSKKKQKKHKDKEQDYLISIVAKVFQKEHDKALLNKKIHNHIENYLKSC